MTKGVIVPRRQLHRLYQEAKDAHEQNVVIKITDHKLIAKIGNKEITIEQAPNGGGK